MRIAIVEREQFPIWKRMRQAVYSDLDPRFHDEEMEWLFASDQAECFLVWSDEGDAIGLLELTLRNFVDGCIGGPVGYIEGIYLHPDHRGQQHGRRLVTFACEWFKTKGCKEMATDAEVTNTEAQAFYRRLGFTERWHVVGLTRSLNGL
ncbi:MAG: GNAT family N-acetyltransferase [Pirellulaceae bacterium]|nr:GNAT family N-acetyltransferase [Pirellulaceae bacterium]